MNNWLSDFYERKPEYRNLRVAKRTPDAIHFELGRGLYEAHLFIDRRFERSRAGLWLPKSGLTDAVRLARKLIRNPQAALYFAAALPFLTTLTLQPDATAGKDGWIRSDNTSLNNGASTVLNVGEINTAVSVRRSLVQFDVSSIPSSNTISAATLSLFALQDNSDNARAARAFRLKRAWTEGTGANTATGDGATWANYDASNTWQTAGGFGANDCEQTDIGSLAFTASATVNQFYDWALTLAGVQGWVSGIFTNNGLLVKMDTEADDQYQFASSDNATAANRPKLVVVYSASNVSAAAVYYARMRTQ